MEQSQKEQLEGMKESYPEVCCFEELPKSVKEEVENGEQMELSLLRYFYCEHKRVITELQNRSSNQNHSAGSQKSGEPVEQSELFSALYKGLGNS